MTVAVEVRPVKTPQEFRAFFEFPWHLYKDDPNWVPQLLSMRRELLDKEKNPAWAYLQGDYFAAWRDEQIVGTITAFVNPRHNDYWNEHIGWFGTFDVYEDAEAAEKLLETAVDWVKERGYDAIRGPQSFTTHEETGLLIENFSRPVLLMPYNHAYYQEFIEAAGFEKTMDVYSLYFDWRRVAESETEQRLRRLHDRVLRNGNVVIRKLDTRNKKEEFRKFRDIYNDAWESNWGFVPMTDRELDNMIESLGMFVEKELAFFAEVDGEMAGFGLSIPDFNIALHQAYPKPGEPELWTMFKLLWYWKGKGIIKGLRCPLLGVKPEYRNKGIDTAILYEMMHGIRDLGYDYVDCGWVLESNKLVDILHKLGAETYKTHRFYEKKLT